MTDKQPTYEDLQELFCAWWAESYPMAPPGQHSIRTHASFALWVLNQGSTQDLR